MWACASSVGNCPERGADEHRRGPHAAIVAEPLPVGPLTVSRPRSSKNALMSSASVGSRSAWPPEAQHPPACWTGRARRAAAARPWGTCSRAPGRVPWDISISMYMKDDF